MTSMLGALWGAAGCGSDDTGKDANASLGVAGTYVAPGAGSAAAMGTAGRLGVSGTSAPPLGGALAGTFAGAGTAANAGIGGSTAIAAGSGASGAAGGVFGQGGQGGVGGGAGGATAGQVAAGGGAAGTGSEEAFQRPCVKAGNEVVFIGDSYSDYAIAHRSLASFVEALAKKDGALTTGSYRNLAVAGTTLAAPPAAIPGQWDNAKTMLPIRAVIMTGGGNDVLISNTQCRPEGSESRPDCQMVVQNSLDKAKSLFTSMEAAGVSDVLYFWYPHIPGGLLTGGEKGTSISDYTYPMLEAIAQAASTDTFHVYTVPTADIFEGHPEYFYSDGLHANDVGEGKIADAIWAVMKDNCIAQAESSGCCKP